MNDYTLQYILEFLQENQKQSCISTATGVYLDSLTQLYTGVLRKTYGDDYTIKPNDHCYWSYDLNCWEENDEHFRNRLIDKLGEGNEEL